MRLQLRFLGGFESRLIDGAAVVLPTRKSKALLAYLALPAGRRHSREKLTALLWGDTAEPQARQNFRQALASIRRALTPGGAGLLIADGDTLGLEAAAVDVDVLQFERLAALTRPDALEGAAALYQGDLLEGLDVDETPFQEWLRAERERLRELALEGLVRLLARQFEADSPDAATQTALRVLAFDPLQESVHRVLMRLYLRQGRRAAALRQYQLCVTALQRELSADPEPETTELYRDLLRSQAAIAGPTVRGSSVTPRPSETPLIGREAEMEYLRRALEMAWDGEARAMLVAGEAGAGKTRLFEELLAEAERLGGRTLFGRGYEGERVLPLRVWVEAIRAGQLLPGEEFEERLSAAERRELARLFPEIGEAGPDGPARPDDLPRLFEALTRLLTEVASRQPLVIALDDLHVADEMTVRLLAFAARRTWGLPLLLVGTVREEDARAELTGILDELERENRLDRLHVAALSLHDSLTLATAVARQRGRARLPADVAAHVWAVSEGNPFVIVETMRAFHADAPLDAADAIAIPLRVKDMIRSRLGRLAQDSRHLSTVAAVIGRDVSFALLQRAAELSVLDAAAGVEELVRRRVLEAVGPQPASVPA